ncbi:hypothetical protein MHD_02270 [Mannheimia granulomatis]|uniref:Uncharacterized protein n=1 Tax=Mannheimia granulomatis TaxID=85402 RepID=A0A011ML96_9PAST|nr:hypothetical protein AK33_00850 [Mannheimia granulomatis]RGE48793.1 hypothetical protein MHD_02270 [Mannheimia granulomatis]
MAQAVKFIKKFANKKTKLFKLGFKIIGVSA